MVSTNVPLFSSSVVAVCGVVCFAIGKQADSRCRERRISMPASHGAHLTSLARLDLITTFSFCKIRDRTKF